LLVEPVVPVLEEKARTWIAFMGSTYGSAAESSAVEHRVAIEELLCFDDREERVDRPRVLFGDDRERAPSETSSR
jgi:hypothetical protein